MREEEEEEGALKAFRKFYPSPRLSFPSLLSRPLSLSLCSYLDPLYGKQRRGKREKRKFFRIKVSHDTTALGCLGENGGRRSLFIFSPFKAFAQSL